MPESSTGVRVYRLQLKRQHYTASTKWYEREAQLSLQMIQGHIARVRRELASLEKRLSDESKNEVNKSRQIHQVQSSITKHTSLTTARSKQQQIERLADDIAGIQRKKADLGGQIARKTEELHRHERDLLREQERERSRLEDQEKRRQRERLAHERAITAELEQQKRVYAETQIDSTGPTAPAAVTYDVFISHASEDKEEFVRPLAQELERQGFKVWYDEFTLKIGDSLRRSIDHGLSNARFGIVVLSSDFFRKNWPQYELDGMIAREMAGAKVVLPIWHKVSKDEVLSYSPSLADRVALNSSMYSVAEIAAKLAEVLRPGT